jgi:hypothetical protein
MADLRLAVVANPRKFDDVDVPRAQILEQCQEAGLDEPLWFESGKKDHGRSKAKKAIKQGATVVAALGATALYVALRPPWSAATWLSGSCPAARETSWLETSRYRWTTWRRPCGS